MNEFVERLHRQEKTTQTAARSTGRPTTVTWRYSAQTRDVPIGVRAKKKTIGFEMRYFVDGVQVTRRELTAAMAVEAARQA